VLERLPATHDFAAKVFPTFPQDHPGGYVYHFDRSFSLFFVPAGMRPHHFAVIFVNTSDLGLLRRLVHRLVHRALPICLWSNGIVFDVTPQENGFSYKLQGNCRAQVVWEV